MKKKNLLWVVYKMTIRGNPDGMNAVCEQSEWDTMELAQPGQHKLIQAGITSEGEAERLARGTSGDPVKRRSKQEVAAEVVRLCRDDAAQVNGQAIRLQPGA